VGRKIAKVELEELASKYLPVPLVITLTITDEETGELVDVPDAEVRISDPSHQYYNVDVTRASTGTYTAGSSVSPVVLEQRAGTWLIEGRSSNVTDYVVPDVVKLRAESDGLPPGVVTGILSSLKLAAVISHTVTQIEIDAGTSVAISCSFVPGTAIAVVGGGTNVSNLVSCDGVTPQVLLAMSDGSNPTPFVAGDIVVITIVAL